MPKQNLYRRALTRGALQPLNLHALPGGGEVLSGKPNDCSVGGPGDTAWINELSIRANLMANRPTSPPNEKITKWNAFANFLNASSENIRTTHPFGWVVSC